MNEETKGPLPASAIDPNFRMTLTRMNRYMGFIGILFIIYGALACLSIIGAIVGIPCIFIGIRMRQAGAGFISYSRSGADSDLKTAIELQTRSFFIQFVLSIIGIVCLGIYIVLVAALIAAGAGAFLSGSPLGSGRAHSETASTWSPGFSAPWSKTYAVSPATRTILKNLDDVVSVKVFLSQKLPPTMSPTVSAIKGTLARYKSCAGKKLHIVWVDPAASETNASEARSLGIPEIQIQTYEKDRAQVVNAYLGIAVLYADRREVLPVVQSTENLEYDLTRAIVKVSRSAMPTVGILKSDLPPSQQTGGEKSEGTEAKFATFIEKLRESYDVTAIDVSQDAPIGKDVKTLVIPGCAPLDDRGLFEIDQYFMQGGNLIVLAGSMRVDFGKNGPAAKNVESRLFDLIEFYGARVERNMVLDPNCGQVTVPQKTGPFTMNVAMPYPYFVRLGSDGLNREIPPVASLSDVILPWPNSITPLVKLSSLNQPSVKSSKRQGASDQAGTNPVTATILAQSSQKSWTVSDSIDLNPQQKWEPPEATAPCLLAVYLHGNFKSYFAGKSVPSAQSQADAGRTVAAANPDGRCVVISNTDFISAQNSTPSNIALVSNLVDWLSLDPNLISIRSKPVKKSDTSKVEEQSKD